MRILALSGSLREGSHNTDLLRGAAAAAPDGVDLELYHGLKEIPPYDADDDVPGERPLAVERFKAALADADAVAAGARLAGYVCRQPGALVALDGAPST